MEQTNEATQSANSIGNFFSEIQQTEDLPKSFSFPEDVKFGLLGIKKWAEVLKPPMVNSFNGRETSAVLFVNSLGKLQLKELNKGTVISVSTPIFDLTQLSDEEIWEELERLRKSKAFKTMRPELKKAGRTPSNQWIYDLSEDETKNKFVLLPSRFPEVNLIDNVILEKGKKVVGTIHVHSAKNAPPSTVDIINLVSIDDTNTKGVITGEELFFLVLTKQTHIYSSLSNDLIELEQKRGEELQSLYENGMPEAQARLQIFMEDCLQFGLALYTGDIATNKFVRTI